MSGFTTRGCVLATQEGLLYRREDNDRTQYFCGHSCWSSNRARSIVAAHFQFGERQGFKRESQMALTYNGLIEYIPPAFIHSGKDRLEMIAREFCNLAKLIGSAHEHD